MIRSYEPIRRGSSLYPLPRQLVNILALRQGLAHAGYLIGREVTGGVGERDAANGGDVIAYGAAGGRQFLRVLRATVRRRRQGLRMVVQPETGHRRRTSVLLRRTRVAMHGTHSAVAVATRR